MVHSSGECYLGLAQSDKPLTDIRTERKRLVAEFIRLSADNSAENHRDAVSRRACPKRRHFPFLRLESLSQRRDMAAQAPGHRLT